MYAVSLTCRSCNTCYSLENRYSCPCCGGILEVRYGEEMLKNADVMRAFSERCDMWIFRAFLPVKDPKNIVSLGEGGTPLLEAQRLAEFWGAELSLFVKAEGLNPSGSFKDRPTSVGVSVAKELGSSSIVISSSGNASAAAAAYAARAGMNCVVFIPETADPGKVVQAQSYGARVISVKGHFSRCYDMALECAKRYGWVNVTSTYINPYTLEGDKTVAYELYRQMKGQVPGYIMVPIGSGPLLTGIYKGFAELKAMGLTDAMPVMVGVQASACEPITQAFESNRDQVEGWIGPGGTVAGGIFDPLMGYEGDGALTLRSVRCSGGMMLSLTEAEILESTALVEKNLGLYCEPTGAVSVGAVKKLARKKYFRPGATVVSLLTGHGFKFTRRKMEKPPVIGEIGELTSVLGCKE